jgi:hypothetical protein
VRYAYFPNPFQPRGANWGLSEAARAAEEGMTHDEYLELLQGFSPEVRIPLIRYENAPDQYRSLAHPTSHLHIGHHDDNRWPLNRVLTPLAFTLLMVKHYYGDVWRLRGLDEGDPCGNRLETALINEKMNCRIVENALFSNNESRSFFLA